MHAKQQHWVFSPAWSQARKRARCLVVREYVVDFWRFEDKFSSFYQTLRYDVFINIVFSS